MVYTRRLLLQHAAALSSLLATSKIRALETALGTTGLKDVYKDDFYIGTAIGEQKMTAGSSEYFDLVRREFNSITMENNMKWALIHPEVEGWDWALADKFMRFGRANDMNLVGHVLVWHSQVPEWVFQDARGKAITAPALRQRMQDHIATVVERYRGDMHVWDVVNEAVDEERRDWRVSPWFNILGPEFVEHAFNFAHEADNKAHLIYNDYNMHDPYKREFVVDMIRRLKKRGVPIHGIGMQGHVGLDFPEIDEFEQSIIAYAREGMRVHITELDMDVLPVAWDYAGAEISTQFEYSDELNPYVEGLPDEVEKQMTARYVEFFRLFLRHKDKIDRVTFWGTGDEESWKNDFPVIGRTNYPLLFDRQYQPKPSYFALKSLGR